MPVQIIELEEETMIEVGDEVLQQQSVKQTLSDLDSFSKKYLLDWEKKSTVRSGKRSRLDKTMISKVEFPYIIKQFLQYPEIKALTQEQLQPFYLQSLCNVLYGVTQFEVNFVTDQCGKLANKDLGIELSTSIAQVAIAIGIDEMYHAFAARELLADIEELTGVIPEASQKSSSEPRKDTLANSNKPAKAPLSPFEYFKNAVPEKLERIAETTLLCILENAVVDDLFEMAKDLQTANPVAIYNREHLQDEGRHKVFFQRLLKYIWGALSEEDRICLGQAIAGYYENYSRPPSYDELLQITSINLQKLPLSEDVIQSIAPRIAKSMINQPLHETDFFKNPMRLMAFAGVSDHPPTRELFLKIGLIAPSLETV